MSFIISSIYSIFSGRALVAVDDQEPPHSSLALNTTDIGFLSREQQPDDHDEYGEPSLLADDEKTLLAECKMSLEEYYKRERFLGDRIERYRTLTDRRQNKIKSLMHARKSGDDEENKHLVSLDVLRKKIDADELCLQSVIELHKDIIAEIEILRRKIDDIEFKMNDIDTKKIECQEMLIVAANRSN